MPTPDPDTWRCFWAKTDRDNPGSTWVHPLWAHLLDVGHTALLLWKQFLPESFRTRLACTIGLSNQEAGHLLSLWIGLHDIGKAIPTFQKQHEYSCQQLRALGLGFDFHTRLHHGHASIAILYQWLQHQQSQGAGFLEHLAAFVGFHHGRLYGKTQWQADVRNQDLLGDAGWANARFALLEAVMAAWQCRYPFPDLPPNQEMLPVWLPGFAGWATLADWLGSMAECFPHNAVQKYDEPGAYMEDSFSGAEKALRKAGFDTTASMQALPFEDLFPQVGLPRPLQTTLASHGLPVGPSLTIVEAPTGEGKTEAAFILAARQQEQGGFGGGLYVAMPTQATSNGLFARTLDFLRHAQQPGTAANFRLVHGNADLDEGQEALWVNPQDLAEMFDFDEANATGTDARIHTLRWFLNTKRALLAPYGLGTVDQVFLGVLYARHFFLRLFALAGKTVIFDEVHAYDGYMNRLFERLLAWLRALDTHVILLSATLPASMRNCFIEAWGGQPVATIGSEVAYPAIWIVTPGGPCRLLTEGLEPVWKQHALLQRHDPAPEAVAASVAAAVHQGAVVGVISNTVARAQAVYQAVQEKLAGALSDEDLLLFHARYRFGERHRREETARSRFGKQRPDCRAAVLVATQVAEQSLDLDFDVLFTDLAPIDLLLQRAGRLHRHPRARPEAHTTPTCYWLCPEAGANTLPDLSDVGVRLQPYSVYEPLVAWKTWRVLRDRTSWSLPTDYRRLIEAVYDDVLQVPDDVHGDARQGWQAAERRQKQNRQDADEKAAARMIPKPTLQGMCYLLTQIDPRLSDPEDEHAHESRKALTRDGEESLEAVVLFRSPQGLFLDPACTIPALPLQQGEPAQLPRETIRAILNNAVRISYQRIASVLREGNDLEEDEQTLRAAWEAAVSKTPALLYRIPMLFTGRRWQGGGFQVEDHDDLGLIITRT
jgi:CRISPR-associated endonuclease/helicase Cas3